MTDALCPSCKASEFEVKSVDPFVLLFCRACGYILAIAPKQSHP